MNEKIQKLAEQANLEIDPAYPDHNQKVMEKFAEYLIKKCAMIGNHAYDGGGYNAGQMIREHFGIK